MTKAIKWQGNTGRFGRFDIFYNDSQKTFRLYNRDKGSSTAEFASLKEVADYLEHFYAFNGYMTKVKRK